jgi:hypothetical protein
MTLISRTMRARRVSARLHCKIGLTFWDHVSDSMDGIFGGLSPDRGSAGNPSCILVPFCVTLSVLADHTLSASGVQIFDSGCFCSWASRESVISEAPIQLPECTEVRLAMINHRSQFPLQKVCRYSVLEHSLTVDFLVMKSLWTSTESSEEPGSPNYIWTVPMTNVKAMRVITREQVRELERGTDDVAHAHELVELILLECFWERVRRGWNARNYGDD